MIKGFICNHRYKGDKISFEDCLSCSLTKEKTCHFSYQLIKAIISNIKELREDITVTGILNCIRKTYLDKVEDYYTTLESLYYAFRGTVFHAKLEKQADDNIISEERYYVDVDGIQVSGKIDSIIKETKTLLDYKTTEAIPKYDKPWGSHGLQTNIYRWILFKNGIEIEKIIISYMDMKNVKEIEVDLMPLQEVEDYVYGKVKILNDAFNNKKIPAAEKGWICNYCAHVDKCNQIEKISSARVVLNEIAEIVSLSKEQKKELGERMLELIKKRIF